ncbi:MAG: nuclear transport factor 2 family protein [Acidobacteria bacterium]|nr:nuclear transport factor 2 family protein [Acidobacteriota bacterium]
MKRLLLLAALALAASACTTDTNTNTGAGNANANANANANTAAATPTPAAGPTQADLEAKERAIWDAIKAKNWDAFSGMLADDFVIVEEGGAQTKAQMMEDMKKYDLTEYTLSDFRMVKVDADLAVLTYTASEKSSFGGKPTSGKPAHASSAWINRGGKWVAVYHQESEAVEMPAASPTPAAAASPAATPAKAATPAASPATIASATDAEKAVWEAIKAKNSDAFGSYLLPEAYEVEPEGVMDKATSVKMITSFDASKWALSEFKETKLDSDATLITYKAAGPDHGKTVTMYHSTIWTNRGGQWKAAFHQGTVAGKGM